MTVCIAALCQNRRKIVSASDTKFSFGGDYSADDIAVKTLEIHPRWSLMYAGNDVTSVPSIVSGAADRLKKIEFPSPDQAAKAVHDSYRTRLHREIESQVLRHFGMTVRQFLKDGKATFTDSIYTDLCDQMMKVKVPLDFIVAGFDDDQKGHLFIVDGDHEPADHTPVGFCAIGIGRNAAESALTFNANRRTLGTWSMLPEAIYGVCEAKFISESASDVGQATFMVILEGRGVPNFVSSTRIDELRTIWNRSGAPRVPKAALKTIPDMVFSVDDLSRVSDKPEDFAAFDRIFGKSSRSTKDRVMKEYTSLIRSTGYAKGRRPTPAAPPDPQSTTDEQ